MTIDCNIPVGRLSAPAWYRPVGAGGRALLDMLLRRGTMVQAALPSVLGLSQPSVARLVSGFVADGVVGTANRTATGRGNPSVSLTLAADHALALGVGMTGDGLSMALVDIAGMVRATRRAAIRDRSRAAILAQMEAVRADLLAGSDIDRSRLVGTGVGFSGFLVGDPPRFNPPALLADWFDLDLAETLSPVFGPGILCDNDATCAAIAEGLLGVGRTTATFAYCHLTNGFGGGLIVDGLPMRGARGNAGDFGAVWWLLGRDDPDVGYPGLDRLHRLVTEGGTSFATVEEMLAAIDRTTPGVDTWLAEAQEPFARLAFLLGHIFAPEKVVIGGRLPAWLAEALAGSVRLPVSPTRNDRPFPLPTIVARQVDGDATAIGAALMPLRALFFR